MQIIPAALLMAGCVGSTESYLAAHPETSASIAASMRQKDVVEGMTREQVRLVWGMPSSKPGWSQGDSWAYNRSANAENSNKLGQWGNAPGTGGGAQQEQMPFGFVQENGGKPRRMVYFRGDQVVLVEKAAGEL